jgi:hypothetical protein
MYKQLILFFTCASAIQPRRSRCGQSVGTDHKLLVCAARVSLCAAFSTSGVPLWLPDIAGSVRFELEATAVCTLSPDKRLAVGVKFAAGGKPEIWAKRKPPAAKNGVYVSASPSPRTMYTFVMFALLKSPMYLSDGMS